jgi:tripartite-type tricarboxylate transporter receptor subunit TctC
MLKRFLLAAILACASCGVWGASASADAYPNKPIRVILGFSGGGGDDYLARLIGPKLTEALGQAVIVDNRPGAASTIAAEITARAIPDGYTMLLASSTPVTSGPSLYPKVGYDLLKDFSYISRIATSGNVLLVHPSLPVKTLAELVSLARSQPKMISYGSAGVASVAHLSMELLQGVSGMQLLHVPYKGAGAVVVALTGGEVTVGFSNVATALPMIQAKRLNVLAVSTAKRTSALPGVPTVAESGFPSYDVTNTFGFIAPAGTPAPVVRLLNAELRKIVQMDDIRAKCAAQAFEAVGSTPEEYAAIMKAELAQWARVIKNANISLN